jgi:hypothetical protein
MGQVRLRIKWREPARPVERCLACEAEGVATVDVILGRRRSGLASDSVALSALGDFLNGYLVCCPINNVAFVAIKMGRRQGARRAHIKIDT